MNVLVTGVNGQLGNEMRIISKDSDDRYIFTDVVEQDGVETTMFDITDLEAIRQQVKAHQINAIVNCAAFTNVDAAESNEALAEKLNADVPENLAKAMKEVDGLLIQISTDYVFDKESYNTYGCLWLDQTARRTEDYCYVMPLRDYPYWIVC